MTDSPSVYRAPSAGVIIFFAILAITLLLSVGCFGGEKTKRGLNYMPDMYESPALKSNEAYRVVDRDDAGNVIRVREVPGMLPPPPGAVARNLYYSAPAGAWLDREHEVNANPLPVTSEYLRLGRLKYDTYCAVCHGRDGNVDNNYLGDKFAGIISLNIDAVAEMTDGHIFDVVTHGIRRMPGYKAQLFPDERWALIHYLRVLQSASALSDEEREQLLSEERDGLHDAFALPPTPVPEYEQGRWPEFKQ